MLLDDVMNERLEHRNEMLGGEPASSDAPKAGPVKTDEDKSHTPAGDRLVTGRSGAVGENGVPETPVIEHGQDEPHESEISEMEFEPDDDGGKIREAHCNFDDMIGATPDSCIKRENENDEATGDNKRRQINKISCDMF